MALPEARDDDKVADVALIKFLSLLEVGSFEVENEVEVAEEEEERVREFMRAWE
jgi:hypothetical protein